MSWKAKRAVDVILSTILILCLMPVLLIISASIKLTSRGPAVFKQVRVGKHGKEFILYKFRTMKVGAEKESMGRYITQDDALMTPLGRFLRRWALDELPQLINVLKGDMSIVGPRPTVKYQVDKYNEFQRKRLLVKPGLTGWAQVNGRNKLNWPERIKYDVWYVENWSLWLDLKIMFMTIPALLRKDFAFADENNITDSIVRLEENQD